MELSQIAVDEFFAEHGLTPTVATAGGFTVKAAGPFELWCGDFFELPANAVAGTAGIYDRGSLVAFPPDMQGRYAAKLMQLAPPKAPMLLITLDYDQSEMAGPPFATPREQVLRLFGNRYDIQELAARSALERNERLKQRGLTALKECAYALRPR